MLTAPKGRGRHSRFFSEEIRKINVVVKTTLVTDILDLHISGNQQIFGLVNPQACQELVGRSAGTLLEKIKKVGLADADVFCQVLKADVLLIMSVHITNSSFDVIVVGNGSILVKT